VRASTVQYISLRGSIPFAEQGFEYFASQVHPVLWMLVQAGPYQVLGDCRRLTALMVLVLG
jgi:hypothetical protein